MSKRSIGLLAVAGVVVAAALWFTVALPGQGSSPGVSRTEDGKPNLNGIWQSFTTANWNIEAHSAEAGPRPEIMGAYGAQPGGMSIIVDGDGTIPYKPEALAERDTNFKNRMTPKITNDPSRFDSGDPELQCFRPGVPRANYMPYPFQIFQDQNQILVVYEYKWAMRQIHIDPQMEAPVDSWMGWSNGKWEGDTLVVDVKGFNGYSWFDRAGNYATDMLHVVERWTPQGPNHLMYEATIEDPNVFEKPWVLSRTFSLRPDLKRIEEFICENNRDYKPLFGTK